MAVGNHAARLAVVKNTEPFSVHSDLRVGRVVLPVGRWSHQHRPRNTPQIGINDERAAVQGQFAHHDVTDTAIDPLSTSDASANGGSQSRRTWWIAAAAVLVGLVGIQMLVTQPLAHRLESMQRDLVQVERDMVELVGAGNGAWETNNLLTSLRDQSDQMDAARDAIETIDGFREQVQEQAIGAETARDVVGQLATLQARLIENGASTQRATDELNRLVQLRDLASSGASKTNRAATEITRLQQIASDLDLAHDSIDKLVNLRTAILAGATDADEARVTLDRLVVIQDTLNTHSADVAVARKNLGQLLTLEESLRTRSDDIADAVEALEVLTDLQHDIRSHVESMQEMRRGLMEVVLLQSTVARVITMLEPLTELARLRRLSGDEIRAAARSITQQRATVRVIPDNSSDQQVQSTRTAGSTGSSSDQKRHTQSGTSLFDGTDGLGIDRFVPPPAADTPLAGDKSTR
jgi:hypothetical protein